MTKPSSQPRSASSRAAECSGRRIDSAGIDAAASCSRRYARLVSVVEASARANAIAVSALIVRAQPSLLRGA